MSTDPLPLGKLGEKDLNRLVFSHLDESDRSRTRLRFGSDYNLVELHGGKALVISTDPLAISPQLGWERSGRLALQVITSDVAVSGISPSFLVANWNLPPNLSDETFEKIWQGFTTEANEVGVKIVGGHTGRYQNQDFPIVGAGTAFGVGSCNKLLPGEFSSGDKIYLLNELGLEAAAIFSFFYPQALSRDLPTETLTRVKRNFDDLNPTEELDALSGLPGLKSLHDLAEGGFLGGVQEILTNESQGAVIRRDRIEIDPGISKICEQLELDPLRITSIGSGIVIVSADREGEFLRRATEEKIDLVHVGEITTTGKIKVVTDRDEETLTEPVEDEFWTRLSQFEDKFD